MESEILIELLNIKNELEIIKTEIREIKIGTRKMEDHISFIEIVYNKIKTPFHYIFDTISKLPNIKILTNINED